MTRSTNHDGSTTTSDRTVSELVRLAQRTLGGELSAQDRAEQQAGLVRFEQQVARRTLRTRSRTVWLLGLGVTAATAGIALGLTTLRPRHATLTFNVVGGSVSDGGYVRAGGAHGTELQFSDGSSFALDPGTSTRVTDLGENGSRVFLESGHAHVRVTPRPHARWTIDAGPYSVRVVGTEFDVRWSGNEEMFDVQLHKGSVVVTGPLASRGLTMEAGQHLTANVKRGEIFLDRTPSRAVESEESPPAAVEPPVDRHPSTLQPAPRAAHVRPGAVPSSSAAETATSEAAPSWSKRVAGGDFQGVLADAERRGLQNTFGAASAPELAALADAARYVRRSDVARRALLAERDRFPKSREGREAAFFLGGLSEDEPGADASKAALDWYDHYLTESPHGAYAPHALGREMVLVHKLRGAVAARPFAVQYLERFPNGPYAAPARKLTEAR